MSKKNKIFVAFLLLLPFILLFLVVIINFTFLTTQKKEVIVEGKQSTSAHSVLVNTYSGRGSYHQEKVANRPEEYFLKVKFNNKSYVIQTTKEIYERVNQNSKINVKLTITRLGNKVNIDNLGINPLSDQQLALRQENIRNIIEDQLKP